MSWWAPASGSCPRPASPGALGRMIVAGEEDEGSGESVFEQARQVAAGGRGAAGRRELAWPESAIVKAQAVTTAFRPCGRRHGAPGASPPPSDSAHLLRSGRTLGETPLATVNAVPRTYDKRLPEARPSKIAT